MKSLGYIRFLCYFPVTGIMGYHRSQMGNGGVFLFRALLLFLWMITSVLEAAIATFVFAAIMLLWLYDVIFIRKIYEKAQGKVDAKIDEIVQAGLDGNYKSMGLKLLSGGNTKVYIDRMIQTGRGQELFVKFCTSPQEVEEVLKMISKRDDAGIIMFIKDKVTGSFFS